MRLPYFHVDAFSSNLFKGNPAAVVPLEHWLPDPLLQSIAAENNLADTAFFMPLPDGAYALRWFTPKVEVDLCGHATLATAFVLAHCLQREGPVYHFESRSGPLTCAREGDRFVLDFPARPSAASTDAGPFAAALGHPPVEFWKGHFNLAVYATAAEVRALAPDFRALAAIDHFAVVATAPGDGGEDFVSRFFAPRAGIDEDPVTGSAHCALMPYWSQRLKRDDLFARQVSARGGELWCQMKKDRVRIGGHAVLYQTGSLILVAGS